MITMVGLDSYSATKQTVGVDWLNLTSGALKSAGGAASSLTKPATPGAPTPDDAAKKAAKKADAPMSMWTKAGIGLALALGGWFTWRHFHPKKA